MATVDRALLKKRVADAKRAHSRFTGLPALDSAILRYADGDLRLRVTDLTVTFDAVMPATGGGAEAWSTSVDLRKLSSLLAKVKGDTLTLVPGEDGCGLSILGDRLDVKLPGADRADFPQCKVPAELHTAHPADGLAEAFATVAPSMANDVHRPMLHGVTVDGSAVMATDSYRLTAVELDADVTDEPVMLTREAVLAIVRSKPAELDWCQDGDHVSLVDRDQGRTWTVLRTEGTPVQWRRLVPDRGDAETLVEVDRAWLVEAAQRVDAMDAGFLTLSCNGTVELSASFDGSAVTERVDGTTTGPEVDVALNPKFLAEVLGAFDADRVTLELRGGVGKPVTVRDGGTTSLLMPTRV